jgi:hypothetical protein
LLLESSILLAKLKQHLGGISPLEVSDLFEATYGCETVLDELHLNQCLDTLFTVGRNYEEYMLPSLDEFVHGLNQRGKILLTPDQLLDFVEQQEGLLLTECLFDFPAEVKTLSNC